MEKRLKILQFVPKLELAGAEIMIENLAKQLKKDSYDVKVVSLYTYQSAITNRLEAEGIQVLYMDKKPKFDFKLFISLFKLIKKEKPDVVHTHLYILPYVMPIAQLLGVKKRVHTIHNIAIKENGSMIRKVNKFFYHVCKVVPVSISPMVKDTIIKEYGLKDEVVPMIYNGIQLERCKPKTNYDTRDSKVSLLHIGRFCEQKNHKGLIEGFRILRESNKNIELKLMGSGDYEEDIKKLVKSYHLEDCVEFLGLKSNVYKYINEADIFVLPSLWEGMPITLIEAMATGMPIVATDVGGISDMITHDESGLVVKTQVEDLVEALDRLIRDKALRMKLGKNALKKSACFDAVQMAKGYETIYND
ncbi:MAG: hypothetical protein CVV00_03970 [Firmicutes bacterium HGW-Firmicutes-5]|nr:MAG: hypothetical protein CVV00_03970 [Firmicutes bacterium HGW-Firmicutes-5]